jgi:hypothetical protein
MEKVRTIVVGRKLYISAVQFVVLVAIATFAPVIFKHQLVTGPIVNATLFISVVLLGRANALLVGLIPSLVALSTGLLPPVLAPVVPFIMVSNALLVLSFDGARTRNFWLGVGISSVLKFVFLYSTSSVVVGLLLKSDMAQTAALMMSWPQLATAIAGGVVAFAVLKGMRKV